MNIKDLIGEATEYDKKLALEEKKPKSWCKSVSAFANTFGGALIFGISNEGMVVGLENPEGDAEKISEVIKTRLDPMPEFKLRFYQTEDGKVLIILDVYKGDETPYYYSGDGVLEAYVRVGNESVKATATELKRLVLRGKNTSYDSQNSTYKAEDYAFSKLKERYKKWTGNSFDDKDLISFGLVNEQGNLTNAGALLADESPIRCSRLFCTRWNGLNKSGGAVDALDDAEYSGSVISLIENGEAFIKRNCKMKWRKTANSREEMPEYVERSYHEALVNALAHRDYLVNGSEVHIDIYDDRMEIYSPGGMPDGSHSTISILGSNIDTYSQKELIDTLLYVPQKGFFFAGTIRENLMYGLSDKVSDKELIVALRSVCLYDSLVATVLDKNLVATDGIDKMVLDYAIGEGGTGLSGGEGQRLSLARVFLRRPKVFVFDESTTGLDGNTAEKVLFNIEEYAKNIGAGIIYISHDGRVVDRCKYVIKLDNQLKFANKVA